MNRGSTFILRGVIVLLGLLVLAFCLLVLPRALVAEIKGDFDYGPVLLCMAASAIPFFVGLFQALKLLGYIDKNKAFSENSVKALMYIKLCAYIISGIYLAGMPYIFYVADRDDAPGLAALGFVIIGASFVVGTAGAVFQKLFQNAVAIKSENDLTV